MCVNSGRDMYVRTITLMLNAISLISHASKVMLKIIMKRIERKLEAEINVVQAGFRKGRGTRDHIFNLRMIIQFTLNVCCSK